LPYLKTRNAIYIAKHKHQKAMDKIKKIAGNVLLIAAGVAVGLVLHDQVSGMINQWKTKAPAAA
jgi:hypothetical protein